MASKTNNDVLVLYRIVEKEGGGWTSDNEGSKFEKVFPPIIGLYLDWDCVDTFFSLGKFLETAVLLFLKVNIYDNMKPNLYKSVDYRSMNVQVQPTLPGLVLKFVQEFELKQWCNISLQ